MDKKPMLVTMDFKVNAYDVDVMGIVSNLVYIRWFEDLRMRMLDVYWPFEEMLKHGMSPILSRTEADYKRPLTFYDKPSGRSWMAFLTRAKWTLATEIYSGEKLVCAGVQSGYFYDLEKKRPVAIPEEMREIFESFL